MPSRYSDWCRQTRDTTLDRSPVTSRRSERASPTCVAYAATVTAPTDRPPGLAAEPIDEPAHWKWLNARAAAGPVVLVLQDLDDPPGGAMWGEWNAHVHRALGCVGTITHGAVRDLAAL